MQKLSNLLFQLYKPKISEFMPFLIFEDKLVNTILEFVLKNR